jgi:hypothetical protein
LQTGKSLANQFGFGRAICTTLEWASCISFVTTSECPNLSSMDVDDWSLALREVAAGQWQLKEQRLRERDR